MYFTWCQHNDLGKRFIWEKNCCQEFQSKDTHPVFARFWETNQWSASKIGLLTSRWFNRLYMLFYCCYCFVVVLGVEFRAFVQDNIPRLFILRQDFANSLFQAVLELEILLPQLPIMLGLQTCSKMSSFLYYALFPKNFPLKCVSWLSCLSFNLKLCNALRGAGPQGHQREHPDITIQSWKWA